MGTVFFSDLREKTETALTSAAENAVTLTMQNIDRAVTLAKDATYDGELTQISQDHDAGTITDTEFLLLSRSYIERKYSREDVFTFALYCPVNHPELLAYSRSGYEETMDYMRYANSQVMDLSESIGARCLFLEVNGKTYLIRNLMNLKMERYGLLILGLNTSQVYAPLTELRDQWDGTMSLCLGQAGATDLPWDTWTNGLQESQRGHDVSYVQQEIARDYTLRLRMQIGWSRLYGEIESFRRLMMGLLLLLLPIMAVLLLYVHRRIVKPVTLLSRASRRIEAGELGVTVPMHGQDELGELGQAFSNMSRRIALLVDKTYKEEIALRDARIQAMQSRINPHFINNALESLNWEARMEGSDMMSQMVESLSVLLNAGMGRGNRRMVPLKEEAEVARAYFYFVGLRFGDRLQTSYQVDPSLADFVVPLLTIQPLLENAVQHGIEPAGSGEISLHCCQDGDCLHITVTNTGKPLSPQDRDRIALALGGDNQGGSHLGLANIANRLQLIYSGKARLTITSDTTGRTVADLLLPEHHEEDTP